MRVVYENNNKITDFYNGLVYVVVAGVVAGVAIGAVVVVASLYSSFYHYCCTI